MVTSGIVLSMRDRASVVLDAIIAMYDDSKRADKNLKCESVAGVTPSCSPLGWAATEEEGMSAYRRQWNPYPNNPPKRTVETELPLRRLQLPAIRTVGHAITSVKALKRKPTQQLVWQVAGGGPPWGGFGPGNGHHTNFIRPSPTAVGAANRCWEEHHSSITSYCVPSTSHIVTNLTILYVSSTTVLDHAVRAWFHPVATAVNGKTNCKEEHSRQNAPSFFSFLSRTFATARLRDQGILFYRLSHTTYTSGEKLVSLLPNQTSSTTLQAGWDGTPKGVFLLESGERNGHPPSTFTSLSPFSDPIPPTIYAIPTIDE
ncbi:hypothetical protein AJ80_00505 [Polytolypa hystricis UAMH7299]|uniref:Uncharacterized protein n=1 Tax=Polytolypa hystricis (strain UAMH7299) TaxID=1447883 RepID=A0A2B7Z3L4_POLH7|nr:hypothetical protein AJ80_00505 [Polytolypa hystricis UAMH7299]